MIWQVSKWLKSRLNLLIKEKCLSTERRKTNWVKLNPIKAFGLQTFSFFLKQNEVEIGTKDSNTQMNQVNRLGERIRLQPKINLNEN